MDEHNEEELYLRLRENLKPNNEYQIHHHYMHLGTLYEGYIDTIQDDIIYELKFVSELEMKHYLQTAVYSIMAKKEKGIVWNTRFNQMYSVKVKDKIAFMDQVNRTVRK